MTAKTGPDEECNIKFVPGRSKGRPVQEWIMYQNGKRFAVLRWPYPYKLTVRDMVIVFDPVDETERSSASL
jgi:hypothetical protein